MRRIVLKFRTFRKILILFLMFFALHFYSLHDLMAIFNDNREKTIKYFTEIPEKKVERRAFITSSYYYPKSKSLGENALALVMSLNVERKAESWLTMQWWKTVEQPPIRIFAQNATDSVMVTTKYSRVTPHDVCEIVTIFATVQLLPNLQQISLIGENDLVNIPFYPPSNSQHRVVVCISPLFVSEQWQNFLFAVHIYRKFGAFMNLYLISAIDSFYDLLKEYENENYLTIQPWVSVKFRGVPSEQIDSYNQIEFRNQASAQCDCLLKYKESANFVTFLDLDDILIPKLAPTYFEEFTRIIHNQQFVSYLFYHKENYDIETVRNGSKFSFELMFRSLKYQKKRETGKIVVNPNNLNYTWIHFPPFMPRGMQKIEVEENVITHLKNIVWKDEHKLENNSKAPTFYNDNSQSILSTSQIMEIEEDLKRMFSKSEIMNLIRRLPENRFYSDLIAKCFYEKYYFYHYSGRLNQIKCPGPQMCQLIQHPEINCVHVNATYNLMPTLNPISFHFAQNAHFSKNIGCFAH